MEHLPDSVLAERLADAPKQLTIWQHYKSGMYMVLTSCIDEETHDVSVVYRRTTGGVVWRRSLQSWCEVVVNAEGQRVRRFSSLRSPK